MSGELATMLRHRGEKCHGVHDRGASADPGDGRAFAMKEVLPLANKLDPEKGDMPHGGLGLGVFEYCLITEELARAPG